MKIRLSNPDRFSLKSFEERRFSSSAGFAFDFAFCYNVAECALLSNKNDKSG